MPSGVYIRTEENIKAIRDAARDPLRRAKLSATRKLQGNFRRGKHHTEESKKKIGRANSIKLLGKIQSIATREKRRTSIPKGKNSHLWRGGITDINKKIRTSFEYRLWREAVFKRDNWTCVFCKSRAGNGKRVVLNADHIKPFSLYPELRFAIDNGRTLCVECHKKTETFAGRIKTYDL